MYQITKQKYLLPDELAYLMKRLDKTRDGLMIKLALKTGARAQELLNIKATDLSVDSVFIHGLKGSFDREIPIDKNFVKDLLALEHGPKGELFDITYPRLVQIWETWRPAKKPFKATRHTFAVELYKDTRDIRLVQLALGHKSINNTLVYAALVDGQEKLREALL